MVIIGLINLFRRKPAVMPAPGASVNLLDQFGQVTHHDGVVLAPLGNGRVLVEWPKVGLSEASAGQLSVIPA